MEEFGNLLGEAVLHSPAGALVTLVTIAVLAVWRGWLVPRATVEKIEATSARVETVQAQRLADSVVRETEWKAAWMAAEEARRLQASQIEALLELAKTTDAFVRSMRNATGGGPT